VNRPKFVVPEEAGELRRILTCATHSLGSTLALCDWNLSCCDHFEDKPAAVQVAARSGVGPNASTSRAIVTNLGSGRS